VFSEKKNNNISLVIFNGQCTPPNREHGFAFANKVLEKQKNPTHRRSPKYFFEESARIRRHIKKYF